MRLTLSGQLPRELQPNEFYLSDSPAQLWVPVSLKFGKATHSKHKKMINHNQQERPGFQDKD